LHYSAGQYLIPRVETVPGATYTFVTGGAGERRSIVSQVNAHAIWGLAAALREQHRDSSLRMIELRINLKLDRPAQERALDPRERPLSADIGDICGGIASSADQAVRGVTYLNSIQDVLDLKSRFPCPQVRSEIPTLWHWQRAS